MYDTLHKKVDRRTMCDGHEHQTQILTGRTINTLTGEWNEYWEDRGLATVCDCERKD